jgi:catechol 2,3-dioxygenase-like lactoylglutathione lyase family enzyme
MSVLSHVFVGTNDIERARDFYDAVLGTLGNKRLLTVDNFSGWGQEEPQFMVARPINGQPATPANGGTIGLVAPTRNAVHEFHRVALANGGTDEGAPGRRPQIAPTA